MSLLVKICGLTTREAVAAVAEAGADAAGFVFARSPRRVSPEAAGRLAEGLPEDLPRVAVSRHPDWTEVPAILAGLRPQFFQTDLDDFRDLVLSGPCRPLPVLRAGQHLPRKLPPLVLFEGPVSGAGRKADWALAATLARRTRVILAGGLDFDNVAEAVRAVRPYGVDVSSGVERSPGVKDPDLILRFVAAAREAEADLPRIGEEHP